MGIQPDPITNPGGGMPWSGGSKEGRSSHSTHGSSWSDADRSSNDNGQHMKRHKHDSSTMFHLMLGFFALTCLSVLASKVLPALLRRVQAARHRDDRNHPTLSAGSAAAGYSRVEMTDSSVDRYDDVDVDTLDA